MHNLIIRKTVSASLSADQWQLFDGEDGAGRDEAAAELNKALEEAINAPDATETSATARILETQRKYSHLGAEDGEADDLVERIMRKIFE